VIIFHKGENMHYDFLKLETDKNILTLTISRPNALNALNGKVLDELECALYEASINKEIKVIIVTGDGEKAFVAGADIKEMLNLSVQEAVNFSRKGHDILKLIRKMSQPVIAAVNGYALGGGFEMALACDIIYASQNAKFGFPEVTLGIIPGFGGTQNLSRITGEKIASELIFTGNMITAEKAKQLNIINEVFSSKDELLENAIKTAEKIASNSSIAISSAKDAILNGINMPLEDSYRYESTLFGNLFATEDQKEGMTAFTEKRKANFKGL
jgi:enoyl-CoA hydratase